MLLIDKEIKQAIPETLRRHQKAFLERVRELEWLGILDYQELRQRTNDYKHHF